MDIEKLKDMLRNAAGGPVGIQMCHEAADALERLQAENDRLKRERDAAVSDLKKWSVCATCKHYSPYGKKSNCKVKDAYLSGGNWAGCSKWEWRGPKEK